MSVEIIRANVISLDEIWQQEKANHAPTKNLVQGLSDKLAASFSDPISKRPPVNTDRLIAGLGAKIGRYINGRSTN